MSNTDAFPLLRKGWSRQKVNQEQIRLATPLVEQGVNFRSFPSAEAPAEVVAEFIASNIPGAAKTGILHGMAALDPSGEVIGAVALGADRATWPGDPDGQMLIVHVRYVAVAPQWRHQGIGTVMLCIMDQLSATENITRRTFVGGCAPAEARFYQRAGFDVLTPEALLPGEFLGREGGVHANGNADYPCWILRTWSPQHP